MKKIAHALAAASLVVVALTGCEIEEDGSTAADRAEVNNKSAGQTAKGQKPEKKSKKPQGPQENVAQESARRSAENYLDTAPFSRQGLVDQLKFEGFSQKDAEYGVDAQKADWNKQAAASAENYLDMSGFSRQGLIDQLKFEGYTQAQAEHGVNAVGL
ncbi:Ltp family lipoprotein [Nocardioides solisilvae]|uniref:Ltp family lipoprotein n=1 Tax=Nocardioides solisilvae TaxID=1542435 RepID=UPI000D74B035|nr:Ltp family lipoprotein [Nocardioides solisilvae]